MEKINNYLVTESAVFTENLRLRPCRIAIVLLCFCKSVCGHYGRIMPCNQPIRVRLISAARTSHVIERITDDKLKTSRLNFPRYLLKETVLLLMITLSK